MICHIDASFLCATVFFSGGNSAADMTLRLIDIQNFFDL
jgi:hypothetical protein